MSQFSGSAIYLERLPLRYRLVCRFTPAKRIQSRRSVKRKALPSHAPRRARRRQPRCDCGRIAVKVLFVTVGSDPQYSVSLPLCSACLSLEQGMHTEN